MQRISVGSGGSPSSMNRQAPVGGTAKDTSIVYVEKANPVPGDLLARTIACRPPNEDRLRGIAA
ncbi:MAG: hypothetical protein WC343_10880 [Bacilli bacterium]